MTSLNATQRFEDRRWSEGPQTVVWRHRASAELVTSGPVLDVGGGDGLLLRLLYERGIRDALAIDLSPVAVARAQAEGFRAEVVDITQPLPYATDRFETVCALDVLEHLYDPAASLAEMARVGRSVVLTVPNFNHWRERVVAALGRVPFQSRPRRGHVYWFNRSVLGDVVRASGLRISHIRFEGSSRLGSFGSWLARARPELFAISFAVRAVPVLTLGASEQGSGTGEEA